MFVQNHVKCNFFFSKFLSLSRGFLICLLLVFYFNRLEQFNDVLFQENGLKVDSDSPLFDLDTLQLVEKKGSTPLASVSQTTNV